MSGAPIPRPSATFASPIPTPRAAGSSCAASSTATSARPSKLWTTRSTYCTSCRWDSPPGYFLDTVAYVAWYLLKTDGSHDERALEALEVRRKRIKGRKDFGRVLTGPDRHTLAVALDKMQLLARTPCATNIVAMRTIVARCLRVLDLDEKTKRRLRKIERKLVRRPENAPYFLARMRASVVSSVPGWCDVGVLIVGGFDLVVVWRG